MADGEQTTTPGRVATRSMVVYDRRVATASAARSWIDAFLARLAVAEHVRDDAQLVLSELVTNGLMHGEGPLVVRASTTPTTIQLAVTDSGDELPQMLPLDPTRIGGLGLVVVDRIASGWGVSPFPGGKTVWATLARS